MTIPDFISLAEAQLERRLPTQKMVKRATATIDTPFSALPADFLSAKSLVFNTGSAEQSVTRVTLRELGVHDGRGRRTLSGLVVGVVVGAALGVVSYSYANGGGCASTDTDSNFCFAAGAVGAAGGALLGAGIGSLIRYDRWRPVPSPWSAARTDRPALGLLLTPPLRSRPGVVGVAIGF